MRLSNHKKGINISKRIHEIKRYRVIRKQYKEYYDNTSIFTLLFGRTFFNRVLFKIKHK